MAELGERARQTRCCGDIRARAIDPQGVRGQIWPQSAMSEFFRFPHTPYLAEPEGVDVRRDKVLTASERAAFLRQRLHVEEKVDGENLGISFDGEALRFQARGSYVAPGGKHFHGLATWVTPRAERIARALGKDLILFGEWCAITHSVRYDALPDWFLVFDVFQRSAGTFWNIADRDRLARHLGLYSTPHLGNGTFELGDLSDMLDTSRVGHEMMEGLVARAIEGRSRAKLVRPKFIQGIEQHWMTSPQRRNRLTPSLLRDASTQPGG
ncbi:RNA ligase family protein [Cellulosimicrobium funkei]|uniref:RNA ligase family protein n=1 Tax=Cellulosimicrobium funkei TaxID=264251 RepID=UPI003B01B1EB